MYAVPAAMPITIPVALPTVAIAGLLVLHVPPLMGSEKVVVRPEHKEELPDIGNAPLMVNADVV